VVLPNLTQWAGEKDMLKKIQDWYWKRKAKRKLYLTRMEDGEVYKILEMFLTKRILEGDTFRRQELNTMQKRIEENIKFLEFLKKI
jgi:hypothetical protein